MLFTVKFFAESHYGTNRFSMRLLVQYAPAASVRFVSFPQLFSEIDIFPCRLFTDFTEKNNMK